VTYISKDWKPCAALPGLLCVLLLGGCISVGPEYTEPDATVETDWIELDDSLSTNAPPADPGWWKAAFEDPELDQLVDLALQENLSLRSAGLRVLQSQQQLAIAVGNQFPQQQAASGSAARSKSMDEIYNNYSLGLSASWEADMWGRFSRQVESASAALDASVSTYDGVLVSLVSQVAQNYILIRTFQSRVEVAKTNIKLQESNLKIAQAKFNAGDVSELDVNQAASLFNNTKASLSGYEVSLQQFKNALAVLLGEPPQALTHLLTTSDEIPEVKAEIALGMPQDLIRRRPDIRTAERQLAAQSAQIGYAVTELYPHFSIGGSVGTSAGQEGELFNSDTENWNIFGMFEWNIFNYGRLRSNIRLQDALFQQLLVDYRSTVLAAQADVENAIVAYLKSHDQLESYQLAAEASARAVNISSIQYKNGSIPFNTVITTLSADAQQQDLLATAKGNVSANLVRVYKSLGGGWQIRDDRDPVDLLPQSVKDEMLNRTHYWNRVLK
jgi:NodT family efflux transporter outer membrane factor (OMF) lipoprotein